MPLKTEINPLPLMRKLEAAGAHLALPAIAGRGKPLIMRAFTFGDELASGQWGIREPNADAPEVVPDILLVPLLAFDRTGHRIGYGAGYYDMTIAKFRSMKPVIAAGIAFAAQEIEAGAGHGARRAPRSRANGARRDRSARKLNASSLCRRCGGAFGPYGCDRASAGAQARLEARLRDRQRRERRRRLRYHRGDLHRDDRCGRRRDHWRQSFMGSARGARVHRTRAAPHPAAQLSARHAGARHGAVRSRKRRARAGDQPDGARLHGPARRSVRDRGARALRLRAEGRRRCDRRRHALRGDEREAGDGPFLRRPREPGRRHAYACADRPITACCPAAPRSSPMSA